MVWIDAIVDPFMYAVAKVPLETIANCVHRSNHGDAVAVTGATLGALSFRPVLKSYDKNTARFPSDRIGAMTS